MGSVLTDFQSRHSDVKSNLTGAICVSIEGLKCLIGVGVISYMIVLDKIHNLFHVIFVLLPVIIEI